MRLGNSLDGSMLRLALLGFLASCVGTTDSKCNNCLDHVNGECHMVNCSSEDSPGDHTSQKKQIKQTASEAKIKSNDAAALCDANSECKNSSAINLIPGNPDGFTFDSSNSEASEIILIVTTSKNISELSLQEWRQKTECINCSERKKIDVLTLDPRGEEQQINWKKIADLFQENYGSAASLHVLVLPSIHASFLTVMDGLIEDTKCIQRVILLDPGADDGLNEVLSSVNAASKLKKVRDREERYPSLEVLGLNTGRSFEKDRRRLLAGSADFFYVELAVSETLGASYLVDWFLTSRLGINGPLVYGKATRFDIAKIRKLTPAAWFQRTSGSKTEDVSDDTLTLMLP